MGNKRLNLAVALAALLAVFFWTQSRVPALSEKAQMGLRTQFNEIAFDIVLPVTDIHSFAERVLRSSINWAWTNWKGMAFGLLFAGAALLILSAVRRRRFGNVWLDTIFGAAAGAPLGVCVNCATPIAQGIWLSGARLETALAALVASPTLNVIVLTMSFTILPWQLATAKLVGVFALLSAIPLIVGRTEEGPADAGLAEHACPLPTYEPPPRDETYAAALRHTAVAFAGHVWFVAKLAVPLMLLAGVLGALVVEIAPFELFARQETTIALLLLAALVATLLPVPIAFDVIAVSALLAGGAEAGIAMTVLFALGIFSIYPALVLARQISISLSAKFAGTVATIALCLGIVTQGFSEAGEQTQRLLIARGLSEGAATAWSQAMRICDDLPTSLHERCFVEQLGKFSNWLGADEFCAERPQAVTQAICVERVSSAAVTRGAVRTRDAEVCAALGDSTDLAACRTAAVVQRAVDMHDVDACNALGNPEHVATCRTQFVSSSLLFNPDDSVCAALDGAELADCLTNARVYRLADTMDFRGCAMLRAPQEREFCRYVIASSMIGRRGDTRGCNRLGSPELLQRCRSQALAWQAEGARTVSGCGLIESAAIRETCMLRIAGLQIDELVAGATLGARMTAAMAVTDAATPTQTVSHVQPSAAPALQWQRLHDDPSLTIDITSLRATSPEGDRQFIRRPASDYGIENPWQFRATDFFEPFIIGKGIASGDFNRDGWPDLVLAGDAGINVYQNIGGRFERAFVRQEELARSNVFVVAFVDANNDGFADIFASTYGGANFLLLNSSGNFTDAQLVKLPGERQLTLAAGFGDLDGDGLIDIVHGNWTSGIERLFSADKSQNEILYANGDSWHVVTPIELAGETNSVLLTDIDLDGDTDLLIGNDRIVPDLYYRNLGERRFEIIGPDSGLPSTSMFTMSLDAADFNNDLQPDLFSTDMTFARSSADAYCDAIASPSALAGCEAALALYTGFRDGDPSVCAQLDTAIAREDCFAAFAIRAAKNLRDSSWCEGLPLQPSSLRTLCAHLADTPPPEAAIDQSDFVRQVQRNTLLLGSADGYVDRAEELGVDSSFWSWNAQAADLDNDGWQDIYVGNGFHFGDNFYEIQRNVLYRNIDGQDFEERAADWGLDDPINTPSYTYIDFDLDGDLDIVATGVLAPPRVFINQETDGRSLQVELFDELGNSAGVGASVIIGHGEQRQRREIRLSGGFLSFDAPIAHFGLAQVEAIDWIEVRWPDGQQSHYTGRIAAPAAIRIHRRSQ